MVLIYMTFGFSTDRMGDKLVEHALNRAESINHEKGFISKIWIHNLEAGKRGGIYVFDTMKNAKAYADMHFKRVQKEGGTDIEFQFFEINEPLSKINHGI